MNLDFAPLHSRPAARIGCFALALASSISPAAGGLFQRTAPPPTDVPTIVRVQIYLDEILLGPGKIDGKVGTFTEQAVELFNQRYDLEPDNWWRVLRDAQRSVDAPFTTYRVRRQDFDFVGELPTEPAEQAMVDSMVYRSVAEFVAERFHTTERFLREINPEQNIDAISVGSTVNVPNVTPFRLEDVPVRHSFDALESFRDRVAYVDTEAKNVKIYARGKLIACFPVTPGEDRYIPYGDWQVEIMVTTPEFRYDKQMLEQGKRSEEFHRLPPGPNNPVGILWAGLNKSGIGLHGTNSPETIGRSRSAGCIRLANWNAIRLPGLIRPGTTVLVR